MNTASTSMTIWEAEDMVDKAQQENARILGDLASATGLWIDQVGIEPHRVEGRPVFTVLIEARLYHTKG